MGSVYNELISLDTNSMSMSVCVERIHFMFRDKHASGAFFVFFVFLLNLPFLSFSLLGRLKLVYAVVFVRLYHRLRGLLFFDRCIRDL